MAIVRHTDGRDEAISAEMATSAWEILNSERDGTDEEQLFCSGIKKIYFNWRNAPDSYIEKYKAIIFPTVIGRWMVDSNGKPSRPELGDTFATEFSNKWGLLEHGQLTPLGRTYVR